MLAISLIATFQFYQNKMLGTQSQSIILTFFSWISWVIKLQDGAGSRERYGCLSSGYGIKYNIIFIIIAYMVGRRIFFIPSGYQDVFSASFPLEIHYRFRVLTTTCVKGVKKFSSCLINCLPFWPSRKNIATHRHLSSYTHSVCLQDKSE